MAHSPKKKAAAVADIISGMPYHKVCEKHGIAKGTVSAWAAEVENSIKTDQNGTDAQKTEQKTDQNRTLVSAAARREQFNVALDSFLLSTITMAHAWAETCSDPDFIRENPTGVNELGQSIFERADKLVSYLRGRDTTTP